MSEVKTGQAVTAKPWIRIPDGIKVRHRSEELEGIINGLTEIVSGAGRNPDGRTQYRVDAGEPSLRLAAEADLLILTDRDNLVIMLKQQVEYRRHVTERLHGAFASDRFVAEREGRRKAASAGTTAKGKETKETRQEEKGEAS